MLHVIDSLFAWWYKQDIGKDLGIVAGDTKHDAQTSDCRAFASAGMTGFEELDSIMYKGPVECREGSSFLLLAVSVLV